MLLITQKWTNLRNTHEKEGIMQEKNMRYGQFLRAKRISDSRELTLKDIAGELGVSVSFVSDVEQGRRKPYDEEKTEKLIEFLADRYAADFDELQAGTGDSPLTIPFYEHCGFVRYGVRKDFFLDNYDHAILEGGRQLVDMIVLRRKI